MESLPPELLTRVFEFVSCDRPHVDIANSRLVSKRFHALSSPFLLTTAVIANRVDTLQKLVEVLNHPYFNKHVTRLVWDASYYDDLTAQNLEDYCRQCGRNSLQSSAIRRYRETVMAEETAKMALYQSAMNLPKVVQHREHYIASAYEEQGSVEMPMKDVFRPSYDDYRRRYHSQQQMRKSQLCLRYLYCAFEKLPKLRHFEFSDFRALSRIGEDIGALCERLFGQTLSPDLLPDIYQKTLVSTPWYDLRICMRNLVEINPPLKSLCFGRSEHRAWDGLEHNASVLVVLPDMHPADEEKWRTHLGSIRHLSFPIETSDGERFTKFAVPHARRLLSFSAPSLTHLHLETELYSSLKRSASNLMSTAAPMFAAVLGHIHFQSLTSIVLRGWLVPLKDLENLLLAHAATLRNLLLINCCIEGASKEELIALIKSKLEPTLALTGVEIYGLMYGADWHKGLSLWCVRADCNDIEELFLGGRRNMVARDVDQESNLSNDWGSREIWWTEEEGEGEEEVEHSEYDTSSEQSYMNESDMIEDEEGIYHPVFF